MQRFSERRLFFERKISDIHFKIILNFWVNKRSLLGLRISRIFQLSRECESGFQFLARECEKCEKVNQDVKMSSTHRKCASLTHLKLFNGRLAPEKSFFPNIGGA